MFEGGVREMAILGSGKSLGLGVFIIHGASRRRTTVTAPPGKTKVIIAIRHGSFVVGVLSYTVALLLFLFLPTPLGEDVFF